MQATIARMALPNDFTVGDGLNTAGIRWVRRFDGLDLANGNGEFSNRDQYNLRFDHNLNANHKFSFSGTRESDWSMTSQAGPPNWPNGFNGLVTKAPTVYTSSLVSTLSPTLLNEFRGGLRTSVQDGRAPFDRSDSVGAAALATMPDYNGIPVLVNPLEFAQNFISTAGAGSTRHSVSPLYTFTDTLSWTQGRHAFKGGLEFRFEHSDAWNTPSFIPVAALGAGSVAVTGIDGTTVPGLSGANQTAARNLLIDLAGSVNSVQQGYTIPNAKNLTYEGYPQLTKNASDWHQNESSAFFKDDWKVRSDLTLNVGVRWEYYGVPYEGNGKMVRPLGGSSGLWGISGTSFADMYQPGRLNGALTSVELVGKNSQQPGKQLYKDDWNNFSPAVGLSWSVPWLGKDKTVLRAGYGMNYTGSITFFGFDTALNRTPGIFQYTNYTPGTYLSLANIPLPLAPVSQPLQAVPLTDRTQTLESFDNNRVDPYIQNWNFGIQHQLPGNFTVEARYLGSKGTKLWGGIPLNDVNIFENGILDAFNVTRAGGNAPLFDQMLRGLNFGLGAVNGTTVTGSASLRQNTTTRAFLANGNVGGFANFLNTTSTATNVNGGLLQNGGLPQNFIVVNPQFGSVGGGSSGGGGVTLDSNPGNSTYHAMELLVTKRLSHGFAYQTSYSWSRSLGENDDDVVKNYLNPRNRAGDKALLGFHHTHDIRSNGSVELPFGPNRAFMGNAPGWVSRLVERWQFGSILGWSSGAPLSLTAATSTFTQGTGNTPVAAGGFPKNSGSVTKVANGVVYFNSLQQIADPAGSSVTALQGTNSSFSNKAITDSQGRLLLVNPAPGQLGTLGQKWIEGPNTINLDIDLIKRVKIRERKEFELRIDALNVLNHPNFAAPTLNIDSTSFGRITAATGNRTFRMSARVNF